VETGVQTIYNYLKRLNSGFRRNEEKPHFQTFYEIIKLESCHFCSLKVLIMGSTIEKEIEDITTQIIKKYNPVKIILFGSAARGELGPDSDADFLIIKKETPFYGADRIRELNHLLERSIPLDLLIYRPEEFEKRIKMGDPFLKAILKEGKVLYG
jgi:predicted nucleotidyltransferase